ncbi:MAG: CPBP family intramembrane metalloprotease [Solobacterium sp.]|nr:CPBP family intramembrane metalloprotease [Solobacterium sp.]
MSEQPKKRMYQLSEKHPILSMVLLMALAVLMQTLISGVCGLLGVALHIPADIAGYTGVILGSVLFLILMKNLYSPQYQGALKSGISKKDTLAVMAPIIIYTVVVLIFQLIQYNFYFKPSIQFLLMAMTAGFGEEVMFRATLIPIGMGFIKGEKRVWFIPIVTALIFGIAHITNITAGASVFNGIHQAAATTLVGFYFGVLYISTGSAVPGIIMHSVYDFICFCGDPSLTNGVMTGTMSAFEIVFTIVISILLAVSAVFILKRIGTPRILQLWKEKWSQE